MKDEALWQRMLSAFTGGLPVFVGMKTSARLLFARNYTRDGEALGNALKIAHIARVTSELPRGHVEGVQFYLYWYWSGEERFADAQRVFRIPPEGIKTKLANSVMQVDIDLGSQPLLCMYGYAGINSLVDVVLVSRSVPGNKKTLFSFSSGFASSRGVKRFNLRATAFSSTAEGAPRKDLGTLFVHVSTASKANYRAIGKLCHNNEEYFFDAARTQRVAGMTHAEGRNFSSRDVDDRLRQNVASLPNIPAGGVVELRLILQVEPLFKFLFPALCPEAPSE